MSFAKEMQDFLGAYQKTTKALDDSAYTQASTDFTRARTRAMTADQDFVDAAVRRREAAIPPATANPTAATGGQATGDQPTVSSPHIDQATYNAYVGQLGPQESSNDPNARARASSATGLFQFTDDTWAGLVRQYPNLGLTMDGRTDPVQQRRALAQFTQDNARVIHEAGQPVTPSNLYMAHFLGAGTAARFLGALQQNPNTPATQLVPQSYVRANPTIFLDGGRPRTAQQVYDLQTRRFRNIRPGGTDTVAQPGSTPVAVQSSPYDAQGQLRPEQGGLSGPAREQAMRTGVAPTAAIPAAAPPSAPAGVSATVPQPGEERDPRDPLAYAEGGLVEDEGVPPRGGMIDSPPAPAPVAAPAQAPVQATATAQGGVPAIPGGAAQGGAMVSAPIPQPRPSEDQIEQQQVAAAMREAEKERQQEAAAPAAPRRAMAISTQEESPEQRQEVTRPGNTPPAQQRPANAPQLPQMLQGALRYLAQRLPAARAIGGQQGGYALGRNEDMPQPSEYEAVSRAVDPSGELSAGQRAIRIMEARHDLALMKGDVDSANKFAAGIIQYSQRLSARLASVAIVAGQNGNMGGMVTAATAAYNAIPAGPTITAGEPRPDGSVPATIRSPGGRTSQIVFTPRQIFESALGLANGSLYWDTLMRASQQTGDGLPTDEMDRRLAAITSPGNTQPAAAGPTPAPTTGGTTVPSAPVPVEGGGQAAEKPADGVPAAPVQGQPGGAQPASTGTPAPAIAPSPGAAESAIQEPPMRPRPVAPRPPDTRGMSREQATIANTQFRTALATHRDELREWEREQNERIRQRNAARVADRQNDAAMTRQTQADMAADRRQRDRIAAERRTAQETQTREERRAARLRDPDGSTVRTLQPEVQTAIMGDKTPEQFQQQLSSDTKDSEAVRYIATGMVNAATKLSHWGNTPQQAAAAVQRMVGVRLPGGATPYRSLGKDSAGNEQVELLTQPQGAREPQPTGIVLRMTPNALREIESLRRAYEPIATRRQQEAGQPSGAAQGFQRIMRGLGGMVQEGLAPSPLPDAEAQAASRRRRREAMEAPARAARQRFQAIPTE